MYVSEGCKAIGECEVGCTESRRDVRKRLEAGNPGGAREEDRNAEAVRPNEVAADSREGGLEGEVGRRAVIEGAAVRSL
jgi:hypothetical protein